MFVPVTFQIEFTKKGVGDGETETGKRTNSRKERKQESKWKGGREGRKGGRNESSFVHGGENTQHVFSRAFCGRGMYAIYLDVFTCYMRNARTEG